MGLFDVLGGDPQYSVSYGLPGAQDVAVPQTAPTPAPQSQIPHGWKNVLGMIGDALLSANGRQPIYGPRVQQMRQAEQQAQLGQSIANYLGNTDAGLAQIFAANPNAGMALYKMKHPEAAQSPETIRLLEAAGVDPHSDEGRRAIMAHLGGSSGSSDPATIRILQAAGIDPQSPEGLRLIYGSMSPSGYLLTPPAGAGAKHGPAPGAIVNGYRFKGGNPNDKASWEPAGGATASTPSLPFR